MINVPHPTLCCPHCGSPQKSQYKTKRHPLIHSTVRYFKCGNCSRNYTSTEKIVPYVGTNIGTQKTSKTK